MYTIKRPYTPVKVYNIYEAINEYKAFCLRCPKNVDGECVAKLNKPSCLNEKDKLLDAIRGGFI